MYVCMQAVVRQIHKKSKQRGWSITIAVDYMNIEGT